ncbi:MAG: hypothetical protein KAS32_06390 [Candidatus Peribacteraceae bacterium]|nr:hypothetical protein [Candidatus Peribacteraceae bacterium]
MAWDYRVVKHWDEEESEDFFAIHEAYYDEDDDGNVEVDPHSITSTPVPPFSSSEEELKKSYLEMIMKAFDKPTLNFDDF